MLFYFVRHAQTECNVQGLMSGGGIDAPLTEHGHQSARALGATIKTLIGHSVHRLWTSDMTRARQTAQYLSEALARPAEIEADLREWHLGEWEGQPFTEYRHLLLGEGEPAQGESRKNFYARVEQAWRRIHSDGEPYVMVSHGAVWLALQDALQMPRFKVENCALVRVTCSAGCWKGEIIPSGNPSVTKR